MRISDIPEFKDKKHILSIAKSVKISECTRKMSEHNYTP